MRNDYIAVAIRSDTDIGHRHRDVCKRTGLSLRLERGNFVLFLGGEADVRTSRDGRSILIGDLFAKRAYTDDLADTIGGDAASLFREYWGGYIAFWVDEQNEGISVAKAPCGTLPCFYVDDGREVVFSSRVDFLEAWLGEKQTIDWGVILRHIAWPAVPSVKTCVAGVCELGSGERIEIGASALRSRMLWSPWDFAREPKPIDDWKAAAEQLRSVIVDCVGAWSSRSGSTLISVSGGLDSSIVASALVQLDRTVTCVTLATDDPAGDERPFARALADYLGVELIEYRERLDLVDIHHSDAAHLPRPTARIFAQSGDKQQQNLVESLGIDLFMTGGGGDNVFCYLHSATPVADQFLARGLTRDVWRTARDVAALTGAGMADVLLGAARKVRTMGTPYFWPPRLEFLSPLARDTLTILPAHPWAMPPHDIPPGKVMHVAWLLAIQNHLEGHGREHLRPMRSPLMSQPVVEHCLAIPSWVWCRGGRDRALARAAFDAFLPSSVLDRRSKGTPTSFVMQVLDAYREDIRTMLTEGHLARNNLLDAEAIRAFLQHPNPARVRDYMQLMALVDVEAWLQTRSRAA